MPSLFPSQTALGYAKVAVERGVDRYPDGLTYAIPPELADLRSGERVMVPLGRGDTTAGGCIISISRETDLDPDRIKFIRGRDASSAKLPGDLIELARWISNYYCAPIGMTLAAMLPAAVKRNIGAVTKTMLDLGNPLPLEVKLPPKQRAVLEALASLPPEKRPIELSALRELAGLKTNSPIRRLLDRKLLDQQQRSTVEATWAQHATDDFRPDSLTAKQQQIIDKIISTLDKGFSSHLLYGVTGSGKTEIYIRLIERVIQAGKTALMLVPEISLTPQTGGRLIGRFADHRVAILHSGLTSAQRHQQWALVANGGAHIILGARSAIFAPVPGGKIGLIIVDEEHDGSYKQDQAPRYHGRDVAIRRAQLAGCPIILGSATPSLESWHNATENGKYALHILDERAPGLRLPTVKVVDFAEQARAHHDRKVHLLGPMLEGAIGRTLETGGQILLLLNRRGYANYIACPDQTCGWVMTCDHCDVTTVYHKSKRLATGGFVQCHHCLTEQRLPSQCPDCANKVTTFGLGTQRVEEEITNKFPELVTGQTMLRIDSDTMHGAKSFHDALERFGRGDIRLMLGTQMIAKGLDFPGVRLVGVINADTALNLPDFRAAERTFQLVSQVAGRCGRGDQPGLAIVQTFNPGVPAIRLAAAHAYTEFAEIELSERRQCNLPPYSRMARIVVRDAELMKCIAMGKRLAEGLRSLADDSQRIRGPAPCPIARLSDRHRQQVEILATNASSLQSLLASARSAGMIQPGASMAVDVDPTTML
ncbi:MAG: primosomal protein N' [Planctomycetes bacterium]|nr:primosomal protein N' [Planctomycetota bacterium]